MTGWRPLVLLVAVASVGAIGTFVIGAATGMGGAELWNLAAYVVAALIVTVAAMTAAGLVLARASLAQRFVAVGALGAAVSLANLWVLSRQMFVNDHDATLLGVLLLYSVGAGVGAGVVAARTSARALGRLASTAVALGEGDLDARTGELDAGPELDRLARTMDEMAARLQLALDRERATEAIRRDLISAISHDLRTPLASLRAMVEAVHDGVIDDPATIRRYTTEMRRSVNQLVTMIDDLFELVQLEAGAIEAETERALVGEVVHAALAAVRLQAEEKGLVLETNLGGVEEVPCSPRLVRVLQGLLVNAVRHTPADGTVRVEARRSADGLELAVADTGDGIPAGDLERVFDPFFRVDPARSGGGAGLGLALAKRIVEALGGRISAESEPARGSRFAVVLPR